jgi:opacity protein-like surface antigen
MHLSISSSADAVKTPSFSPATLFVSMWEPTKFNEHQWKLVFTGEQAICRYNKTDSTNSLQRQKHEPLRFSIHGCKRLAFFSLAKIYYKAENITQLHGRS